MTCCNEYSDMFQVTYDSLGNMKQCGGKEPVVAGTPAMATALPLAWRDFLFVPLLVWFAYMTWVTD